MRSQPADANMPLADAQEAFFRCMFEREPPAELALLVASASRRDAVRRMNVYRSAYWARQLSVLEDSFACTAHELGAALFRGAATEFLTKHRSTTFAIERIGRAFPEFATGHANPRVRAIAPLARLEWARVDCLLAPDDASVLTAEELATFDARRVRLRPASHFRLETVSAAALALWAAVAGASCSPESIAVDGASLSSGPPRLDSRVAVWRRAHGVWHEPTLVAEGEALALALQGASFERICERLAESEDLVVAARVVARWLSRGYFAAAEELDA